MKILYGVQGTGNGHISRAHIFAKAFAKRSDIEVDYLFSGRAEDEYFDMDAFGDYQTRRGITYVHDNGVVRKWKTIRNAKICEFYKDIKTLDLSHYDLVLNDFEPVSAWAAKLQRIPSISISHQVAYRKPRVPKKSYTVGSRLFMKYYAPCAINVGILWYHFGHCDIIPPFVEEHISFQNIDENSIIVYLPWENLAHINAVLKPFKSVNFFCYHPDVMHDQEQGHIKLRKICRDGFRNAFYKCAGVITNGGFDLPSECLKFGKKLLVKPLHGQWEQVSNASLLSRFGLAQNMKTLNTEAIAQWLAQPAIAPIPFPHDPMPIIDWLVSGNWNDTASLCDTLWDEVRFSDTLQEKLKEYSTGSSSF